MDGSAALTHFRCFRNSEPPKGNVMAKSKFRPLHDRVVVKRIDAEEKTKDEMNQTMRDLIKQSYTPQQAHDTAWEIVRERYILLPPENP